MGREGDQEGGSVWFGTISTRSPWQRSRFRNRAPDPTQLHNFFVQPAELERDRAHKKESKMQMRGPHFDCFFFQLSVAAVAAGRRCLRAGRWTTQVQANKAGRVRPSGQVSRCSSACRWCACTAPPPSICCIFRLFFFRPRFPFCVGFRRLGSPPVSCVLSAVFI